MPQDYTRLAPNGWPSDPTVEEIDAYNHFDQALENQDSRIAPLEDSSGVPVFLHWNNGRWEVIDDPSTGLSSTDVGNLRGSNGQVWWTAPVGGEPVAANGLQSGDVVTTY